VESTVRSVEKFAVQLFSKVSQGRAPGISGAGPRGNHVCLTVDRQAAHRNGPGGNLKLNSNLFSEIRRSESGWRDHERPGAAVGTTDSPRCGD